METADAPALRSGLQDRQHHQTNPLASLAEWSYTGNFAPMWAHGCATLILSSIVMTCHSMPAIVKQEVVQVPAGMGTILCIET